MTTTLWARSGDRQSKKVAWGPAPGAKVQFYSGGTTTPLTTYTDAGASTPHNTASLVTDGNGMWPMIFVPYGSYDYRILDSDDTIITTATNVPNPAPVDPTSTDPNALMQTGDMIFSPAAVTRAGFVRANGNTIGSGASSATERANDDAETLFTWLWDNLADAQAAVSSGRGGTAAADWSANKTIATPDLRGSSPIGLDDMGASAASRFTSVPFTHGNATTGGSAGGANTFAIAETNLPAHVHGLGTIAVTSGGPTVTGSENGHTHSGQTGNANADHTHQATAVTGTATTAAVSPGGGVAAITALTSSTITTGGQTGGTSHQHSFSTGAGTSHTHSIAEHAHALTGETASVGSGTAINIVARAILGTWLIKL